jgi:predicted heme/steroid binding protein
MLKLTRKELLKYNGRDGAPAYVAYRGKVYDVSDAFLWKGGRHQALHESGRDLTDALDEAPHGPEFLDRYSVVGELESE